MNRDDARKRLELATGFVAGALMNCNDAMTKVLEADTGRLKILILGMPFEIRLTEFRLEKEIPPSHDRPD